MRIRWTWLVLGVAWVPSVRGGETMPGPAWDEHVLPLLKARCVKCHGPSKREGGLSLATPGGIARGGKDGVVVVRGRPEESPLWERVDAGEMPPKEPLAEAERDLLRRWIERGAPGLPTRPPEGPEGADHWAFAPAKCPSVPRVRGPGRVRTPIDSFLQAKLEEAGGSLGPDAAKTTLLRRVSFDLTGLPPTPGEVDAFLNDAVPDAYERMVERYLASPHYGERWGKYWLDAAGYADSNGYFNADSDRPLAFRYRDYVIRSWNQDKPLDRFIQEQVAGDELSGFRPGGGTAPSAEDLDRLVATHFLRNAPDGTGESDGNPDEVRADRYAVLEGTTQIIGSALFGLTFQCARCHDHKFEPITQKDYYQIYAVLWPAFDLKRWVKPQARVVEAAAPGALEAWEARSRRIDAEVAALRTEFASWVRRERPSANVRFLDEFNPSVPLDRRWSATAPGDDAPAGTAAVHVDSETLPGAIVREGTLRILEAGGVGNRWLSTRMAFDWTPVEKGGWIQATFQLVDTRAAPGGTPAERVGYYIALHDFDDNGPVAGGNVLIDGNPAGGAAVHVDYPGSDSDSRGVIGGAGYVAGRNYGVRITNLGEARYQVEHLVDWAPEGKSVTLSAGDLPDGGFGFEFCCGRSFVVDDVLVETGGPTAASPSWPEALKTRRRALDESIRAKEAARGERPGKLAWVADLSASPTPTHLLRRGLYHDPGPEVPPGVPSVLHDRDNPFDVRRPTAEASSSGRRLAFARWLTRPGSRPSALLARVLANRLWQNHFGTGLVATPENLGYSGTPPTHPELLEYLAATLAREGWRPKALHRLILVSTVYRQSSLRDPRHPDVDPENRRLGRFPTLRLDAEAIRDAMLAVSGALDERLEGPYVPASRTSAGEVVEAVDPARAGRRSVYLQQRRTQVVGLLDVFDAPSIVTNCTRRTATTMPLQSLSLLNSDFVVARALDLARRIEAEAGPECGTEGRITRAFVLALGRPPLEDERAAARAFLGAQPGRYPGRADAPRRAWADLCQMLFASNAFLYVD